VQRFVSDPLFSHAERPTVPYCDGCPPNKTLDYDHCKRTPSLEANVSLLVAYAERQAAAGTIDSLDLLASRRIYLYRGLNDTTYKQGSVRAARDVFAALRVPDEQIHFEASIQSAHLLPTVVPHMCWWEEWKGPDNCTYDGAKHALSWIHGPKALAGGRRNDTEALAAHLREFDQLPFTVGGALLNDTGKVFVPPACEAALQPGATAARCTVHVFLHGCGVTWSFDTFAEFGGFNNWAMDNQIVVVYPQMSTLGKYPQQQIGCWDGYGQTGAGYDQRAAPQMRSLANIAAHFSGRSEAVKLSRPD
jgi:poly(3-hydroxybutyrate) depolymerase